MYYAHTKAPSPRQMIWGAMSVNGSKPSMREVAVAHGGPSMFSTYARWRSMPPIQGDAEISGSTKNQHAGVA